jgi:hypothetical protein
MIHTYSRLSTWRQCPRRFYEEYIIRRWPREETPAMREGTEKHKVLEDCIKRRVPPSGEFKIPQALFPLLWGNKAEPEVRLAVNRNGAVATWDDAWIRGVIDVYAPKPPACLMIDWKTGRSDYTDDLQGKVYAALCYPKSRLKQVIFVFSYIKYGVHKPMVFEPEVAWREVRDVALACESDDEWLPRKNALCGWCPVKTCEYNYRK